MRGTIAHALGLDSRRVRKSDVVKPHDYRDLIASYVDANFGDRGLVVYTEVSLGKTIIGKNRQLDVFVLRKADQRALGIECKYQDSQGTTDEKIPYALQDLEAMWIPGCLVYAGGGWSKGVLHTPEGSRLGVYCLPERPTLGRTNGTRELDHVLAAVFGLWDQVIPVARLFGREGTAPVIARGPKKATARPVLHEEKKVAEDG